MNKKFLNFLFNIFVTSILLSGVSHGEPLPIKIGFVADFSSVSKAYTENVFQAMQMAVSEFNNHGGLLGRPIEMVHRDGGNDPNQHYQHVVDLVLDEKVVAIFGGASSPCVLQASAASYELKIPYLVSMGNAQSVVVEKGHPYVFMFEPNTRMESLGFSMFATLMPWQRYAWIGPDYFWGRDILASFKKHFEEIGAPIEWTAEIWHPLGTKNYEEGIKRVIDTKPEALVVATWGEDLRYFLQQAKAAGLFDKMAVLGWFSIISGKPERVLPEGIWKISRGPFNYLADKYPQTKTFVENYTQQFSTSPLGFTVCGYDSILAWREAVLKSGSVEPAVVAETLKGMSFVGLRGDSYIRAIDGQLSCPVFFGRLVYRPEYPFAVIESVIEIPASRTWLSEQEVKSIRSNN